MFLPLNTITVGKGIWVTGRGGGLRRESRLEVCPEVTRALGGGGRQKDPVPTQTTTCLDSEFSFSLLKDFQRKTLAPNSQVGERKVGFLEPRQAVEAVKQSVGGGGGRGGAHGLGDPVRGKGLCHLGVPSSTPTLPGWLVFLPLPTAPPI